MKRKITLKDSARTVKTIEGYFLLLEPEAICGVREQDQKERDIKTLYDPRNIPEVPTSLPLHD